MLDNRCVWCFSYNDAAVLYRYPDNADQFPTVPLRNNPAHTNGD